METLTNARTAREWMLNHGCPEDHLPALCGIEYYNVKAAKALVLLRKTCSHFGRWSLLNVERDWFVDCLVRWS